MLKKSLAVTAIALGLVVATASSASAGYTGATVVASPNPVAPGATTTITASGLPDDYCVEFGFLTDPPSDDYTLDPEETPVEVEGGVATATFSANAVGTYVVSSFAFPCGPPPTSIVSSALVEASGVTLPDVSIVVQAAAPAPAPSASAALPPTGGEIPAAAIWLGVGAVGIGAIAVTAAVARRRAAGNR